MGIAGRILKMFKADVNHVLDCLEEPETLLKQAVRDMEDEVQCGEEELTRIVGQLEEIEAHKREVAGKCVEFEKQLEVCFRSANDLLAKAVLRKKLEGERMLKAFEAKYVSLNALQTAQEKKLKDQKERLASIHDKMSLFIKTRKSTDCCQNSMAENAFSFQVSEEEVEVAFLKEREQRANSMQQQERIS